MACIFYKMPYVFSDAVIRGKNVAKVRGKVRNVCPMLVIVKKRMNFAHSHIKRNVLTNGWKLNIDLVLRDS